MRTRSSGSTQAMASMCAAACTPAPSTASVEAPSRASARVATALTAAVRIAVTAEASTQPVHAAVLAVEDDDDALVRVEAARRVLREDRHGLEPERGSRRRRGARSSGP